MFKMIKNNILNSSKIFWLKEKKPLITSGFYHEIEDSF